MKFRANLILSIFLLVVTPIVITSLITMEAADKALQSQALELGHPLSREQVEIARLRENIVYIVIIGTVVSLTGAGIFTSELSRSVNKIKQGLDNLSHDANTAIDVQRGIMGEIAASINQLAANLRETRSHRDALLESSPNGIITVDKIGKIILFNPAASILTGIPPGKALGTNYQEIGLPPALIRHLEDALTRQSSDMTKEEIFSRPDGNSIAVAISISRLHDDEEIVGALAMIFDLREKRLLEAKVLRANRLAGLGELAAGIAHEIRNPFTAVKGYSQVLEDELDIDDPRREYTAVIVKEVNRLDRIVQGLLDFARPSVSKFELDNLNQIIEETLVLIEKSAFKDRIELQKDYGENVLAEVDKDQIKQILLNMFINAGQSIQDQGTIRIVTRREGEQVAIRIIDSGMGISQAIIDKLFDPFFTTKEKGTGLGLAIAHQLIELHGGKIEVCSRPNSGAEFKLILPIRQGGVISV
ncbi:PAS/PAC sensor signal transduction histidine kinase [Desulfosporosinus acidiphilus SJ4]|uniref:histidine kinase n=1 Tax=Desulfosporosinus acidiphilus (strain DSM 22704 / JCM 16185 / SJ4) TaxID=646529 RepID=I4D099_DESAJ|nr:ATP-binding protein [Desulfosporosinus acidiphilus]AFM39223.1 PAS/PAC sensor signal transduction histidine kinase [Desulfosporosinus acidiphilus SJ4]